MKEFAAKRIALTLVKVNERCEQMIKVMKDNYETDGMVLNITDLANACATKSQAEVTQDFIKAASYILTVTLGGKTGETLQKPKFNNESLWDIKQIAP